MSNFKPYIVKQGDHVEKLAYLHGASADDVWNDPSNAALKSKRKSMHQLLPGDIVNLPEAPSTKLKLNKGTTNHYQAMVPLVDVSVAIHTQDGPLANAPYTVNGLPRRPDDPPLSGTTGPGGEVKLKVPVTTREVIIVLPQQRLEYAVLVGGMDPADEPSGVKQRLQNLGFLAPGAPPDADLSHSFCAFQQWAGIPITGTGDAATLEALDNAASGKR